VRLTLKRHPPPTCFPITEWLQQELPDQPQAALAAIALLWPRPPPAEVSVVVSRRLACQVCLWAGKSKPIRRIWLAGVAA
jgi:hypothetical protein